MPLLGNLIYAGLATLLSTQTTVGAIATAANLYSINTGAAQSLDVALFTPVHAQGTAALAAGVGFGVATLQPSLFTRTGAVVVWYNPNTTAVPGEMIAAFAHSRIR